MGAVVSTAIDGRIRLVVSRRLPGTSSAVLAVSLTGRGASGSVTSLLPHAIRSFFEGKGAAQWAEFVAIALLAVLLIEYDLLRVWFGRDARRRLRPLAIVIAPLLIVFVVVIAHRWRQLSR